MLGFVDRLVVDVIVGLVDGLIHGLVDDLLDDFVDVVDDADEIRRIFWRGRVQGSWAAPAAPLRSGAMPARVASIRSSVSCSTGSPVTRARQICATVNSRMPTR